MEQRNEQTTAEIVSGLRSCPDCDSCLLDKKKCLDIEKVAADRLEQLERENAVLKARAEKAEAERDAADNGSYDLHKRFESISDEVRKESPSCKLCGNFPEMCAFCLKYNAFELRGLRGKGNA